MKFLFDKWINFLRTEKSLIGRIIFLNTPVILGVFFFNTFTFGDLKNSFHSFFYVTSFSVFIAAILFFVGKISLQIKKFLKYLFMIISAIIFLTDLFTFTYYETMINRTLLEVMLATNANETTEFFSVYVFSTKFLLVLAPIAILFLFLCKVKIVFYKKFFTVVLIVSLIFSFAQLVKNPKNFFEIGNSITRIAVIFPEVLEQMKTYHEIVTSAKHEVKITRNESDLPLIIFVLGESTTRNHMQLYGYNLPTTPEFCERNLRGELKIFSDTVSPHFHTMAVLKKLFTFLRNGDTQENISSGNFFEILNAAGYHTIWLSNQESGGIYGNVGKYYSESCSERKFTRMRDSKEETFAALDEELLPLFVESLNNRQEKSFYVLHLMGTHSSYDKRYPSEYKKFSEEDEISSEKIARKIRAKYDNAVLYNDHIVNQIIEQVKNFDAIVIYVSDHGEDVYDEKDFAGHNETNPSRFMIEVPFIIWTSESFRANHPKLEKKFSAAVDKPFMTDDMIHFLLDMMKIETPDFKETFSALSENYNSERQRTYGEKIYDKEGGLR